MIAQQSTKQMVFGEELEFDEGKHAYKWAGKLVPGVTTILSCINKPALIQWAANRASDHWLIELARGNTDYPAIHKTAKESHHKKKEAAGNIGHNVHGYAECFIKNKPLPKLLNDQAKRGVEAFHKWMDAHNVKFKASERRIFSKQFYYAGTCDFVGVIDGVMGVGDFKTSSGIYPEMRMQTAAYQHALQEEKGIKFPVRWIVRFDKTTGDFEAKSFYQFDLDFKGFTSALDLHRTLQSMKEKEN